MPATLENTARNSPARPPNVKKPQYPIILRCYAYRDANDVFIGECIDLNIMVIRKTMPEVQEALSDAVVGYLKTVHNMQEWSLLKRPSPLAHRLRYHFFCLRAALACGRKNFILIDHPALCAC